MTTAPRGAAIVSLCDWRREQRLHTRLSAPDQPDFPPDFDPDLNPIIAQHWFGHPPHGLATIWWRFARQGHRLPAERGVIVIEGGR